MAEIVLRKWQAEALPLVVEAVKAGLAPVVSAFMGAGKAILAAMIVRLSKDRPGYSVIVAAPNVKLVDQLAATFGMVLGADCVGKFYGEEKVADRRVIICTYRSLLTLAAVMKATGRRPALLICDEAHRTETVDILAAVAALQALVPSGHLSRIAITATVYRSDKKQALSLWDEVVYRYSYQDGIRDGVIVPCRVVGWDGVGDREDVDTLTIEMMKESAVYPALVDSKSILDSEAFAARLTAEGIPAGFVHSKMRKEDAERVTERLRIGELSALVHVSMLAEGADFPWLRTLVCRRRIGARVRFVQQCGRPMRADPNNPEKTDAVIIDPLDLFGLFGLTHPDALGKAMDEGEVEDSDETPEQAKERKKLEKRNAAEAVEGVPIAEWLEGVLVDLEVQERPKDPRNPTGKQLEMIEKMLWALKWWPHKPAKERLRAWVKDGRIRSMTRGEASRVIGWLIYLANASKLARAAVAEGDYFKANNLMKWPDGWTCPLTVPWLDGDRGEW